MSFVLTISEHVHGKISRILCNLCSISGKVQQISLNLRHPRFLLYTGNIDRKFGDFLRIESNLARYPQSIIFENSTRVHQFFVAKICRIPEICTVNVVVCMRHFEKFDSYFLSR